MLKQVYKYLAMLTLLSAVVACATDAFTDDVKQGNTKIEFAGQTITNGMTRGNVATLGPLAKYTNLYLSSKLSSDNTTDYFSNISLDVAEPDNKIPNPNSNLLSANAYYPLGETRIKLFAHTGVFDNNGKIALASGQGLDKDVLISNGTDGTGTEGKSTDPVKLLTFRHVMTKVEIKIDTTVDGDMQDNKPSSVSIGFGNLVTASGKYSLTTNPGDAATHKATDTGGAYEFKYTNGDGINYVVPNGTDLTGQAITSLQIDDYTATQADLAAWTFPSTSLGNNLVLKPGLSYTLTFKIKRLKLVGIELTLNDWNTIGGTGTWGYEPYPVSLNITNGGGTGYDETKITKMVLKHTVGGQTYQYIGQGNSGTINFVTLPTDLVSGNPTNLKADLYTQDELLIKDIDVSNPTANTLSLVLGDNGLKQNVDVPAEPYFEITTPLQFALFMNSITSSTTGVYRIVNDLDMDNTSVDINPPGEFPSTATLDGAIWDIGSSSYKVHKILHLNLSGNGLIVENKGILRNLYLASGTITSTNGNYSGSICAVNNGTIAGCVNQTNIVATATQTAGGICGLNGSTGKVLACLNAGNIANAITVGGISGENKNVNAGSMTACLNVGSLNKSATNLGGICGKDEISANTRIVDTCYWLTGTARKHQAVSNEIAIGNKNTTSIMGLTFEVSDLAAQTIRSTAIYTDKLSSRLSADKYRFTLDSSVSSWPIPVPIP